MRFLGKDNAGFYSNALPQGLRSEPELIEAYRQALDRQGDAFEAWQRLMTTHMRDGSQWSAVMHCAMASGMTSEDLRNRLGASPSTLSRWLDGVVQPARMLRKRLEDELIEFARSVVARVRGASSELPVPSPPILAVSRPVTRRPQVSRPAGRQEGRPRRAHVDRVNRWTATAEFPSPVSRQG
jgi:hypothetical protein